MARFAESETLELKKSTSELKEALVSIAAMLNKHQKGELIFGVKNNGIVLGQQVSESTLRAVSKAISDHIEPKVYPTIKKEIMDGKSCIRITFEGREQPYLVFGRAYVRVADENKQLSAKELENMILRKTAIRWDSRISEASINDAYEQTLKEFIQKANLSQRIKFKYTTKKEVLEKLQLARYSKLNNAAKLLFSKNDPLEAQAAVFAGTDKTTFVDIKQFKGNIFQLLTLLESYIKERINWRAKLFGRTREEIPEIPIRAITEALVNSFCHRDYQAPESNKIAIYKDRVEIWNPGDFPEGFTPQDFINQDLPSILRNPTVANCLYLCSDIEKWGSGLKRISKECKANSVKVDFKILKYGFAVQFTRPEIGTVSGTVNGTEKIIINVLLENPESTIDEIVRKSRKGRRTIVRYMNKLKERSIIKRVGSDKKGYWEIEQK